MMRSEVSVCVSGVMGSERAAVVCICATVHKNIHHIKHTHTRVMHFPPHSDPVKREKAHRGHASVPACPFRLFAQQSSNERRHAFASSLLRIVGDHGADGSEGNAARRSDAKERALSITVLGQRNCDRLTPAPLLLLLAVCGPAFEDEDGAASVRYAHGKKASARGTADRIAQRGGSKTFDHAVLLSEPASSMFAHEARKAAELARAIVAAWDRSSSSDAAEPADAPSQLPCGCAAMAGCLKLGIDCTAAPSSTARWMCIATIACTSSLVGARSE